MASWLKAAEDLFEVVDRRAKSAVGDKLNELVVPAPGLSPCIIAIWWQPAHLQKAAKLLYWGCQDHKIPLEISKCVSYPVFLSGVRSSLLDVPLIPTPGASR